MLYTFVKPPVHGWAFTESRRRAGRPLRTAELTQAYDRLSRWSRFWLADRRVAGHDLPYCQHGNDFGWPPASVHYEPDGYWRGPIWAPATVLVEAGLCRSGFDERSDTVSSRYLALCERSGFAETSTR